MNDTPTSPTPRGIRTSVAILASLGALLVGLAAGAALGGMLGYVAGQQAGGTDIVVPPAIERLGLVPDAPAAGSTTDDRTTSDDGALSTPPADGDSDGSAEGDAPDSAGGDAAEPSGGASRSKGGRQAGSASERPRLGVEVATEPLAVSDYTAGARVMTVAPRSAAAAAGIREGDVIVAIDGTPVRTSDELAEAIAAHDAGDVVALIVLRGEAELTFDVTLGAAQP